MLDMWFLLCTFEMDQRDVTIFDIPVSSIVVGCLEMSWKTQP